MVGMPEIVVFLFLGVFGIAPWIAAIWALLTLQKMRTAQDAMRASLERIEQRLP